MMCLRWLGLSLAVHVALAAIDCGSYVCPDGFTSKSSPASIQCSCCNGGATCQACVPTSTSCTANDATNTAKCCDGNKCDGGPTTADPNAATNGYASCMTATSVSGNICVPTCKSGYLPDPAAGFALACVQPSRQFDASGVVCKPVSCPATVLNSNGIDGDCSCNPGYSGVPTVGVNAMTMVTEFIHTCTALTCNGVPTPATADPNAASYAACNTATATTCLVVCNTGYELPTVAMAPQQLALVCEANGQFDASAVRCQPMDCTNAPAGVTSVANFNPCTPLKTGDLCSPTCADGYSVSLGSPFALVCTGAAAMPSFTAASASAACGEAPCPAFTVAANPSTCLCDTALGYTGTPAWSAAEGRWTHTCNPQTCLTPNPVVAVNDYADCLSRKTAETCTVYCAIGHIAGGTGSASLPLVCSPTNTFPSGVALTCTAAPCPDNSVNPVTDVAAAVGVKCAGCAANYLIDRAAEEWDRANNKWVHECRPTCNLFTCPTGYVAVAAAATTRCSAASVASCNTATCCTPNTCTTAPTTIPNAVFTSCTNLVSGQTCGVSCDPGYQASITSQVLVCPPLAATEYPSSLVCPAISCSAGPKTAADINADYSSCNVQNTAGTCTPVCNTGYTLQGAAFALVCEADGYDATGVTCTANTCTAPTDADPNAASYTPCLNLVTGQTCTPTCNNGFILTGTTSIALVCNAAGGFSVAAATCTLVDCPINGIRTVTAGQCVCGTGYSGTPVWTGASWTGQCTADSCTASQVPNSVSYSATGSLNGNTGDTITIVCQPGFQASRGSATCLPAGAFDVPTCDGQPCPQDLLVQNAATPAGATAGVAGQSAVVTCRTGFQCSVAPCVSNCEGATLTWSDLKCNAIACPTNAHTPGACTCNTGYIASPAVNFDSALMRWTHTCWASCGFYTCPSRYRIRQTPSLVQCTTLDLTSCNDQTCCVGITVTPDPTTTKLRTTEGGGTASFTVVLVGAPTADVTVAITSTDTSEGFPNPSSLIFSPLTWSQAQTVTVRGVDDDFDDGDTDYTLNIVTTSADGEFNGAQTEPMQATNADDDEKAILVKLIPSTATQLTVQESGGASPQFTVELQSRPTAPVSLTIASSDTTEGILSVAGGVPAPTALTLTFSTTTWNVPQTITVTGVDDSVDDGDVTFTIVTRAASSTDVSYNGLNPPDISVRSIDDDTRGFEITAINLLTTESGGTGTFTIRLKSEPISTVTTTLTTTDGTEGTVSPGTITFSSGNWLTPFTVTCTGVEDLIDDGDVKYTVVTTPFASFDGNYNNMNPDDVIFTNQDDDTASVTVNPISGLLVSEVGASQQFTVVLASEPTAVVYIEGLSRDPTEGKVSPARLTFTAGTAGNWNVPQTFTVTGVDDEVDDGDVGFNVTAVVLSGDSVYDGIRTDDVQVVNADNDTSNIIVTPTSGLVTSEAGGTATFTMYLGSKPVDTVTITLLSDDSREGTVQPRTVVFTPSNWKIPETITVTGAEEFIADGNQTYRIVPQPAVSTDTNYNGMSGSSVTVLNIDDDRADIKVTPVSGLVTTERNQKTDQFTVTLMSKPLADVTIGISSSNLAEGTLPPGMSQLLFTNVTWDVPQRITVTGVDDTAQDGDVVYTIRLATSVSTDPNYNGVNGHSVSVTNEDDDIPGILVQPNSTLTTKEKGGSGSNCGSSCGNDKFDVSLTSIPAVGTKVFFKVSVSDTTEAGVQQGATLEFDSNNWNQRQLVEINGLPDSIDDGDINYEVILEVDSTLTTDINYKTGLPQGMRVAAVNIDEDTAGIVVTPQTGIVTSEAGGSATVTVTLATKPVNTVYVRLKSDPTEGELMGGGALFQTSDLRLNFTSTTWNIPQTITVLGVDDWEDDGDITYNVTVGPVTSDDLPYNGMTSPGFEVLNTDNDTVGIQVTLPVNNATHTELVTAANELITKEAETTNGFDVVLMTRPTDTVTIWCTSGDISEAVVSPGSLIFTVADWNISQRVRVTGKNDFVQDGNIPYTVSLGPVISADTKYSVLSLDPVKGITYDDDLAGIFISGQTNITSITQTKEDGQTVEYTIALKSEPLADVVLPISSTNILEGTVRPAALRFTSESWGNPQTIVVTGVDDSVADGKQLFGVDVGPAQSIDQLYSGMTNPQLQIENLDDDVAGFTVSPLFGLSVTEQGTTTTFTVVLDTKPATPQGSVDFTIVSQNTAELTVMPASLSFSTDNWNVPQTITVTGVDDLTDEDVNPVIAVRVSVSAAPNDILYTTLPYVDVNITNVDTNVPGIRIADANLRTEEAGVGMSAGTATFKVVLDTKPTHDVTVGLTSTDLTEGTIDVSTVVLSATLMEAVVTVTGVNDDLDDGDITYSITTSAALSQDPDYNGKNPVDVTVVNVDDDTAGVVILYPNTTSRYETREIGSSATFTVRLTSQPESEVRLRVTSWDATEGLVNSQGSLSGFLDLQFQTGGSQWGVDQTVRVVGQDDDVQDGDVEYEVRFQITTTDQKYSRISPAPVLLVNRDDDVAEVVLTTDTTSTLITTEAGGWVTFTVHLRSQPSHPVQIKLMSSDTTEGVISSETLQFTASNWGTKQIVNVTGRDDSVYDGDIAYRVYVVSVTSNDLRYHGANPGGVQCTNRDDDTPGVTIRPTQGGCYVVGGTNANRPCIFPFVYKGRTYTSCAEESLDGLTGWCSTSVNAKTEHELGSEGQCNAGCTGGLTTTEGGNSYPFVSTQAAFTVWLSSIPTHDVTIDIASDDLTEGTVSPSQLMFRVNSWNVPQSVVVMSVDDNIADGNRVYSITTAPCVSRDANYNGIVNPPDVLVNNTDDDVAGITVSATATLIVTEGGTTAEFTVVLNSQPQHGVSMAVNSTDLSEGTVSPAALLFTSDTWQTKQTVTVTGVADNINDEDQTFYVHLVDIRSMDESYRRILPIEVRVQTIDQVDECIANSQTCMASGQVCNDPDLSRTRLGDWQCVCQGDAMGSPSRGGPAECADPPSGECLNNGQTCRSQGQFCTEGAGTNDWQCNCPAPASGRPATRTAANCVLDECVANAPLCTAVGQRCVDPNTQFSSLDDWMCQCVEPQIGFATRGVANCEWKGECSSRAALCTGMNQTCNDPNTTLSGDWECACIIGVGRATSQAASCILDECIANSKVCSDRDQRCRDPNQSPLVLGDWVCECIGSRAIGTGSQMPATCLIDECTDTTVLNTCLDYGQLCVDPDMSPSSLNNWRCECVLPATGSAVLKRAECLWPGECALAANRNTCINPGAGIKGQTCHDPNPDSRGDWQCQCVPPYRLTVKTGAPATCVLDECDTNRAVCQQAGQTCLDPNTDSRSTGDWMCLCGPQALGEAVGQAAMCAFQGECVEKAPLCAAAGQTCVDTNLLQQGDWQCVCVSPQMGRRAAGIATCSHDECIEFGQICRNYGQECNDPTPFPRETGDWTCNCIAPATGASRGSPAPCSFIGECAIHSGVCTTRGQTCRDPDVNKANDWECACVGDSVGTRVGNYSTECELDECKMHGSLCTVANQKCVDRNMNTTSLDDWGCACTGGQEQGFEFRRVATCQLDECLSSGQDCQTFGQRCIDPNTDPSSTGDWMCVCQGSSTGSAVAKASANTCRYTSECAGVRGTECTTQGKTCVDPEESVTGDVKCQCVYPYTHSRVDDSTCELDECLLHGHVCLAAGQRCEDPIRSPSVLNNWVCQCLEAGVGSAVAAPAICSYQGECAQRHTICTRVGQACFEDDVNRVNDWGCTCATDRSQSGRKYGGPVSVCQADDCLLFDPNTSPCGNQRCEDPNTSLMSRGDWKCVCTGSDKTGEAVAQRAVCVLDECVVNSPACSAKGQVCSDPVKDPSSLGNWKCDCVSPATGSNIASPATCSYIGECAQNYRTCEAVGQTCNDPNPNTQNGDWECVCVGKLTGRQTGRAAECRLDECLDHGTKCNAVGQVCIDPDPSTSGIGNWECRCVSPAQGRLVTGPALCQHVGECVTNAITCEASGQACRDPDLTRVGDWECICIAGREGRRVAGPATCLQDECVDNLATCAAVGQTCQDPTITDLGVNDWQCDCVGAAASGSQRAGVADCQWQGECGTNYRTCTAVGQTCTDPSLAVSGDWRCECVFPQVGSRQGKPAPCVLDECLRDGLICAREGQSCLDPNTNPLSLNDWECICQGSSTGKAVAAIATCQYEGECVANAVTCTKAGQYCRDRKPDTVDDWECRCVAPFTGAALGSATVCSYDECLVHGQLCTAAGQICFDSNQDAASRSDWECRCDAASQPVGTDPYVMRLAECRYGGECASSSVNSVCTAAGQTCIDSNPQKSGDWECSCVTPRTGAATKRPATCTLNECSVNGKICTSVGQSCVDPNQQIDSLNDWTCECQGSEETGSAVGRAATCILDECNNQLNWDVCAKAGQLCKDPNQDPRSTKDWTCQCGGSGSGSAVTGRASCQYSGECATAFQTCSSAEQMCVDKDSLTGTWECQCVPPYSGSARASVAVCIYDECEERGKVCATAGQRCFDPNKSPGSRGDWECQCLPPMTGAAKGTAAVCSFVGECTEHAVVCIEKGQLCTDPDTTKLGDWACICVAPQSGANQTIGPATCILDECLQYGSTCTKVGQACIDPDKSPMSPNDWMCKCVSPGKGSARGIAAQCAYTTEEGGECVNYATTCAAAGQACNDPDTRNLGDWECICVPPTVGRGVASTTVCVLDECLENSFVCSAHGQLCSDPNKSPASIGDWICECQGSGSGTGVRSPAACSWSGECVVAHTRCVASGQTCTDPTTDPTSTGDWRCDCVSPQEGTATAQIAMCTFDECLPMGSICSGADQVCIDVNTSVTSMGDWECRCKLPTSGAGVASTAVCILDECGYAGSDLNSDGSSACAQCQSNRRKCSQSGQTCRDPDATRIGDWECVCPPPQVGSARGVVAMCSYDECLQNSGACTSRGQVCTDPSKSIKSVNDWKCSCQGSAVGEATGAPATCVHQQGDCLRHETTCTAAGQACLDPNPLIEGDWKCVCVGEQKGEATGGAAVCQQDECEVYKTVCSAEGQICLDPNTSPSSTGDWACRCTGDAVGVAKTRAANCVLDECVHYGTTCQAAGQLCLDPNTSPASTGDWTCKCTGSSSGQGRTIVATCAYTGECASNAHVCTSQGQTCYDPSTAIGDWVCRCVDPATSKKEGRMEAATCELDECTRVSTICSNRGQACNDPNISPLSTGDWTCKCQGSGTGSAVATPAICTYQGECATSSVKCSSAGQACADRNVAAGFDCVCVGGSTGSSSRGVAPCTLNECVANEDVCKIESQTCSDPNTDFTSLGDWKCSCTGSDATGTAVGKAAICTVDECLTKRTVCESRGQICYDPNQSRTALGDWTCTCLGSGSSQPKAVQGAPANCVYSGECNGDNAAKCEAAGQTCIDPDQRDTAVGDWLCSCVPPRVGQLVGGVAVCTYDECIDNAQVCNAVGQNCFDKNTADTSLNDWECHCIGTTDAKALGPATCNYPGECATNSKTCTSLGQTCTDPNRDQKGDWQCECVSPQSGSPSPVGPTTCVHDECTGNSQAFLLCHSSGQQCVDPNTSPESLGDWRCTCVGSSTGSSVGTLADCVYVGECARYSGVCTSAGQTCSDPNPATAGDWECVCVSPAVGKALGASAKCVLDECPMHQHLCGNQQVCRDPNPTSAALDDWLCECQVGSGVSRAGAATCIVNECSDAQVSAVCTDAGQTCSDPNPSNDVKGDWMCHCVGSGSGSRAGGPSRSCTYVGECQAHANICSAAGQACFDPSENIANDWQCLCVYPLKGTPQSGGVAACLLDECEAGSQGFTVCGGVGQLCVDPMPFKNSTNDWTCNCVKPAVGQALRKAASCIWENECEQNHPVCTAVGQTCTDATSTLNGDWMCECVAPSQGTRAIAQVATCEINECSTQSVCADAGQTCNDPNFAIQGDWECRCAGEGQGKANAKPAICGYASLACNVNSAICTSNGQACKANGQEFTCECLEPLEGNQAGAPAVCRTKSIDECEVNSNAWTICNNAQQDCNDPDRSISGNWMCKCRTGTNTALQKIADCSTPTPGVTPAPLIISDLQFAFDTTKAESSQNMRQLLDDLLKAASLDRNFTDVQVIPAEGAGSTRVVFKMRVTSLISTPELAERYRRAVEADTARVLGAAGHTLSNVVAGDCVINAGMKCVDTTQACHDTDGVADNSYTCHCPEPQSGRASNAPATCLMQCEVSSTCKKAVANLTSTIPHPLSETKAKEPQIKTALAKAMGVPESAIKDFTLSDDKAGGTFANFTVEMNTETGTNETFTQGLIDNINKSEKDDPNGFLAQEGLTVSSVSQVLAAPATVDEDDDCFLGLGWSDGACAGMLAGIIIAVLLLAALVYFCVCRTPADPTEPAPKETNKNNRDYRSVDHQLTILPSPASEMTSKVPAPSPHFDDVDTHMQEPQEVVPDNKPLLTPHRDDGVVDSPQGDYHSQTENRLNFNDASAYSQGRGRGAPVISPTTASPHSTGFARGRSMQNAYATIDTEAPGTSGWV